MNILDYSLFDASICKDHKLTAFSELLNVPNYPIHGEKYECKISLYSGDSMYLAENIKINSVKCKVLYTGGVSGIGFHTHEMRSKIINDHLNN